MAYKISFLPKARSDIDQIDNYISQILLDQKAAKDFFVELFDALDKICLFPRMCPLINNEMVREPTLRKLLVQNYIVFYKVEKDEIIIIRVLHQTRDFYSFL